MGSVTLLRVACAWLGVLLLVVAVALFVEGWGMQPIEAGVGTIILGGMAVLASIVLFIGWGILGVLLEPYRERAERNKLIRD